MWVGRGGRGRSRPSEAGLLRIITELVGFCPSLSYSACCTTYTGSCSLEEPLFLRICFCNRSLRSVTVLC